MSAYISPKWDRHRPYFLKTGFIIALIICIVLINWNFSHSEPLPFNYNTEDLDAVVHIPRTPPAEKKKQEVPITKKLSPKKEILKLDKIELVEDSPKEEPQESILDTDPDEATLVADTTAYVAPIVAPIIEDTVEDDTPLRFAERMPLFGDCLLEDKRAAKACSDAALIRFVSKHLKYPTIARENNVQGTVVIRFVVNKEGEIDQLEIAKDIGANCGKAALEAVKKMKDWTPGKQNGRPVSIYFTMPVQFRLQ